MSKTFSQVDYQLVQKVQALIAGATRNDRRFFIAYAVIVAAILDRWILKRPHTRNQDPFARVHERTTTWSKLQKRVRWPGENTSFRTCVNRLFPAYLVLPTKDGGQYDGIRIIRIDSAGRGLLREIAGKYHNLDTAKRLARADKYLDEILDCIDPAVRSRGADDIEGPLNRLYDLWEHGDDAVSDDDGLWEDDQDIHLYHLDTVVAFLEARYETIRPSGLATVEDDTAGPADPPSGSKTDEEQGGAGGLTASSPEAVTPCRPARMGGPGSGPEPVPGAREDLHAGGPGDVQLRA